MAFLDDAFLLFVKDRKTCRVQRIREKSTEMSDVISPSIIIIEPTRCLETSMGLQLLLFIAFERLFKIK